MKPLLILLLLSSTMYAEEAQKPPKNKSDLYIQLDERITELELQLMTEISLIHNNQVLIKEEMLRLNDKLESRFDKYFLWGYGTLLVVISTLVSVIFNKQKIIKPAAGRRSKMVLSQLQK
jgi:hypothetical protein